MPVDSTKAMPSSTSRSDVRGRPVRPCTAGGRGRISGSTSAHRSSLISRDGGEDTDDDMPPQPPPTLTRSRTDTPIRTRRHLQRLLNGVERLGVVEVVLPAESTPDLQEDLRALISLVAELVVTKDAYGDVFARLRRRKTFSLAAEIQWELLPPLTFGTERIGIAGGLEPAYDIGGDAFDYAVNGDTADLLVLDSVGHGLGAAVLASVAVGAYRHARRTMADLPEIAREVNDA